MDGRRWALISMVLRSVALIGVTVLLGPTTLHFIVITVVLLLTIGVIRALRSPQVASGSLWPWARR